MATKSTLEQANIALKAQLAQLAEQVAALTNVPNAKAEKPLVSRGYFKRLDEPTGKWVDDSSKPCFIVAVPDAKPRKASEAVLRSEINLHAEIADAFFALTK